MNLTEHLEQYDCHLVAEDTSHEELISLDKDLPSDVHLVRYWLKSPAREELVATTGGVPEDLICISGIRAYKKADIFDGLHDGGYEVLEITQGYGRIRPNLYGVQGVEPEAV